MVPFSSGIAVFKDFVILKPFQDYSKDRMVARYGLTFQVGWFYAHDFVVSVSGSQQPIGQ